MSIRDKIVAANDTVTELVEVPEWGVTVEVRSLSAGARTALMEQCLVEGEVDVRIMYPDLVVLSTYDPEDGERVFGDDDRKFVQDRNSIAVDRIAEVAFRLSGMDQGSKDEAGKDSPSTESSDSPS